MPAAEHLEATVVNSKSYSNPTPSRNSQSTQRSRSLQSLNGPANAQKHTAHSGCKRKRPQRVGLHQQLATDVPSERIVCHNLALQVTHDASSEWPPLCQCQPGPWGVGVCPLEQPDLPTSSVPSFGKQSSADDTLSDSPATRVNHVNKSPSAAASRVQSVYSADLLEPELPIASSRVKHETAD